MFSILAPFSVTALGGRQRTISPPPPLLHMRMLEWSHLETGPYSEGAVRGLFTNHTHSSTSALPDDFPCTQRCSATTISNMIPFSLSQPEVYTFTIAPRQPLGLAFLPRRFCSLWMFHGIGTGVIQNVVLELPL